MSYEEIQFGYFLMMMNQKPSSFLVEKFNQEVDNPIEKRRRGPYRQAFLASFRKRRQWSPSFDDPDLNRIFSRKIELVEGVLFPVDFEPTLDSRIGDPGDHYEPDCTLLIPVASVGLTADNWVTVATQGDDGRLVQTAQFPPCYRGREPTLDWVLKANGLRACNDIRYVTARFDGLSPLGDVDLALASLADPRLAKIAPQLANWRNS